MTSPDSFSIMLNGEPRVARTGDSVASLVQALGLHDKRIAVERNGEIVPRSRHAHTPLSPEDRLEIVVAVGGG